MDTALEKSLYVVRKMGNYYYYYCWNISKDTEYRAQKRKKNQTNAFVKFYPP